MNTTQITNDGPYDVNEPGITKETRQGRARLNYRSRFPALEVPPEEQTLRDVLTRLSLDRPEWRKRVFLGYSDTWEELAAYAQFAEGVGLDDRPSADLKWRLELHLDGLYKAAWRERTSTERGRAYIAWVREQMGRVL